MTKTLEDIQTAIVPVLEKYSLKSSVVDGKIVIRDKKQTAIGSINTECEIERNKRGQQVLMGALIRNDLASVLA